MVRVPANLSVLGLPIKFMVRARINLVRVPILSEPCQPKIERSVYLRYGHLDLTVYDWFDNVNQSNDGSLNILARDKYWELLTHTFLSCKLECLYKSKNLLTYLGVDDIFQTELGARIAHGSTQSTVRKIRCAKLDHYAELELLASETWSNYVIITL